MSEITSPDGEINFFDLVELRPLDYLVFPDKNVRGLAANKTQIIIRNISKKPIAYRVVQKKDNLVLKVRPFIQLVLPNEQKRIEILNDSDRVPTLNARLIIEVVQYKQNIEEWSPKLFEENANLFVKDKSSYEYKLYQTNLMNIVSYEYALKQIENRILSIEHILHKWILFETQNTQSTQITISLLVFTVVMLVFVENYLPNKMKMLFKSLYKFLNFW